MSIFRKFIMPSQKKSLPANYLAHPFMRSYMVMPGQPVWSQRDYQQFSHEGYAKNVIAYRSVAMIASAAASIPFILYQTNRAGKRELENHPVLNLLKRPNPMQSSNDFLNALFHFKMIAGNAYVQAVAPKDAPPAELYLLRPDRVQIIAGKNALPAAYRYTVDDKYMDFPVNKISGRSRILHVKNFHPTNDWYGLSPIEAAAYSIDQHNQASQWNQALMQNGARPSGALVVKSEQGGGTLSEDQYNRMKLQIDEQFSGAVNAGRPLLLEGGLEWREMSLSPKDMDFINSKHASARDIALAFGVPPQLLGIPGDNTYSNFQEARLALWEQTILPQVQSFVDALNYWLMPMFGNGLELAANTDGILPLAMRNQAIWDRVERASFLTDNEKREAVGYEAREEEEEALILPSFMQEPEGLKYSPDQPRVGSGNPDGGQWTSSGGGGGGGSGYSPSALADRATSQPTLTQSSPSAGGGGRMSKPKNLSLDDAIAHLERSAFATPQKICATCVREALNAGGIAVKPPSDGGHGHAKNFGKSLEKEGFHAVSRVKKGDGYPPKGYTPSRGDVVVIQATSKNISGHMAMYNGKQWISDYKQPGFWPGTAYRKELPEYAIYRYPAY